MNSATLYTLIGLALSAVATIGLPLFYNRSKTTTAAQQQRTMDSQVVAQMFRDERDRLQLRIEAMQDEYERQIAATRAENEQQITALRSELQGLYRQIHQQRPGL